MKGIFLFYGEAFRLGGQHTRNTGAIESYHEQMKACYSHMDLIHHLNHIDVYISSYTTQYDNDLLQVYDNVIGYQFYEQLIGQQNLIDNGLKKINVNKYDFIFILFSY